MPHKRATLLIAILAALAGALSISGCANPLLSSRAKPAALPAPVSDEQHTPERTQLIALYEMLTRLRAAGTAEQAEMLSAMKTAADASRDPLAYARHAIASSTIAKSEAELNAARAALRTVLARPEALTPWVRAVAQLELQRSDQQLALMQENVRLLAEADRTDRDRLGPLTRRLRAETEENARLRKALEEAQTKLDSVTNIEQSINQRGATKEGPKP